MARPKGPGATEREIEARLAQASEWMLLGWTDRRVAAEVAHVYGLSLRSGYEYVTKVRERWAVEARARADTPSEDILKEHADRFRMLLDMSVREKSLKTAVMAAERLAQLEGLLTTKAVTHSGKVGLDLNPEVDEAALEVLRARGWAPPEPPADPPSE